MLQLSPYQDRIFFYNAGSKIVARSCILIFYWCAARHASTRQYIDASSTYTCTQCSLGTLGRQITSSQCACYLWKVPARSYSIPSSFVPCIYATHPVCLLFHACMLSLPHAPYHHVCTCMYMYTNIFAILVREQ
jgi:hypothetical protein